MIQQFITVGKDKWDVVVCYGTSEEDREYLYDLLLEHRCPSVVAKHGVDIVTSRLNTGMTYTDDIHKTSIVYISDATSSDQFVNTAIHEAKHVQSHICAYYNVNESSERAAYLMGYLVQKMYKMLRMFNEKYYGRFQ